MSNIIQKLLGEADEFEPEEIVSGASEPPPPEPTYAEVSWNIHDLEMDQTQDWSDEQKADFLNRNAEHIREAMVEAGYRAIEAVIGRHPPGAFPHPG